MENSFVPGAMFSESTEDIQSDLFNDMPPPLLPANDTNETSNADNTAPISTSVLTPAGYKRTAEANAKVVRRKLTESTLELHTNFKEMNAIFKTTSMLMSENLMLKNMLLRQQLGFTVDNNGN